MRRRAALALLALLLGAGLWWQCQREPRTQRPTLPTTKPLNVILIVVDTLRSDRLSGPAGEPAAMPAALAFARRGVLFPNAIAPAPWTVPSMTSLLTGLLPREHRVERMPEGAPLLGPVTTWAQAFASRGYQTAAYTGGPWYWEARGSLLQGFAAGTTGFHLGQAEQRLETWHRGLDPRRPYFLLLHSYEAHDPYGAANHALPGTPASRAGDEPDLPGDAAPWQLARRFMLSRNARPALHARLGNAFMDQVVRYIWSGYRAEPRPELAHELSEAYTEGVRWVDGLLGRTLEWLERAGCFEDSVVILTADHGEAFGEHGYLEHGRQAFDEVVRVPLVLFGPEPLRGGRVVTANVSLLDALPTAVALSGGSMPPGMRGRSLLPVIRGEEGSRIASIQDRMDHIVTREDLDLALRALRSERWKAIATWDTRSGQVRWEAYDLKADPLELADLARGSGSLAGLAFDEPFEAALEGLRQDLVAEGAPATAGR